VIALKRLIASLLFGVAAWPAAALASQPTPLADARRLYNEGRYAEAIEIAESAPAVSADAEVSRLVSARARLERFRETAEADDLDLARAALVAVDANRLSPRDHLDLLVGMGETLFLEGSYGAAAEMFATALERADALDTGALDTGARDALLDWWASATDRMAHGSAPDQRDAAYERLERAMRAAAGRDPASAVAAYWVAAAARARGDAWQAWDAALAAWVRAPLTRDGGVALRPDLDRLVTEAIVPERARKEAVSAADIDQASAALLGAWEEFKARWSRDR
jgi:tetratricopeptide (TPR) repeat protein